MQAILETLRAQANTQPPVDLRLSECCSVPQQGAGFDGDFLTIVSRNVSCVRVKPSGEVVREATSS